MKSQQLDYQEANYKETTNISYYCERNSNISLPWAEADLSDLNFR